MQIAAAGVNYVDRLYVSKSIPISISSPILSPDFTFHFSPPHISHLAPDSRPPPKQPLPHPSPVHPRPRVRRHCHHITSSQPLQSRRPRLRRHPRFLRRVHNRPCFISPPYPAYLVLRRRSRSRSHSASRVRCSHRPRRSQGRRNSAHPCRSWWARIDGRPNRESGWGEGNSY